MEWIKERWCNHPCLTCVQKDTVMQSLWNIQGTKDVGYAWYQLLYSICISLEMVANTTCKFIFPWDKDGHQSLLALATNGRLFT